MSEHQLMLAGIIVVFVALLKAIRDSISHSDALRNWGYWFSRFASERSKYLFMVKHPFWGSGFPKFMVMTVICMFLDAWHFAEFLLIVSYAAMAMVFYPNPFVGFLIWMSISTLFNLFYAKLRDIRLW